MLDFIKNIIDSLYRNISAEWWMWLIVFMTILIPFIFPNTKTRKSSLKIFKSKNFISDFFYGIFDLLHFWHMFIIVPLSLFLGKFLNNNFSFFKLNFISDLPVIFQLVILFVVMDFSVYWMHRFQHSNIYAWQFHKTHHSQEIITALTTFRKTILDRIFELIILTFPAFILSIDYSYPLYIVVITYLHQLLIHTNTGFNFGFVGKFIVSPAFHEVHHSINKKHMYANYGGVLTAWDKLFGTYMPYEKNLKYGVHEEKIPENFFMQIFVPIVGLYRLFKRSK